MLKIMYLSIFMIVFMKFKPDYILGVSAVIIMLHSIQIESTQTEVLFYKPSKFARGCKKIGLCLIWREKML